MAPDRDDKAFQLDVFRFLDGLADRELVDFLYEALGDRQLGGIAERKRHFVLGDVERNPGEKGGEAWWSHFVVALPHPDEPASPSEGPPHRYGHCGGCSTEIATWGVLAVCPVCGETVQTDFDAAADDVHSDLDRRDG